MDLLWIFICTISLDWTQIIMDIPANLLEKFYIVSSFFRIQTTNNFAKMIFGNLCHFNYLNYYYMYFVIRQFILNIQKLLLRTQLMTDGSFSQTFEVIFWRDWREKTSIEQRHYKKYITSKYQIQTNVWFSNFKPLFSFTIHTTNDFVKITFCQFCCFI